MTNVLKNIPGHSEPFNGSKLHRSLYRTCLSVQTPSGEAKLTAEWITKQLTPWVKRKTEITSADIRRKAGQLLAAHNPLAAYMYQSQANLRTYPKQK